MRKSLLGVLLAVVMCAAANTPPVPATALAPEYAVALPPGSVRTFDCSEFAENVTCYTVPVGLEEVMHLVSTQLRGAGYDLTHEEPVDVMSEFGFEVEQGTLMIEQDWERFRPPEFRLMMVRYIGTEDRTLITVYFYL